MECGNNVGCMIVHDVCDAFGKDKDDSDNPPPFPATAPLPDIQQFGPVGFLYTFWK